MDLSVFRQRLSTLGADIGRWPDNDEAVALLAESDEAVALLANALRETPEATSEPLDTALTEAVLDAALGRGAD
ncbi:hypothetical protein B7G68_02165 [Caulobacter segnis]|uniref:Uncharacterized protein n=3 Tax=Caulobacter segnis TaxID=88688 RepID=D5VEB1_CAUST|nr:conserved hypothetical protein [Caulobacter segnis ATCC 21756]AVQ00769.1 hypothetical protein B7G68_02165 [Caulobacter segnis]